MVKTYLLDDEAYDRLVAALLDMKPSPFTGEVGRDEVIWALADEGVFPARSADENTPAAAPL